MAVDKFFVGAWIGILVFCLACWAGGIYAGHALLRHLGL